MKKWYELPQYMLSVRPQYTALELEGKKLADVRVTAPFIGTDGATVWIYETKNGGGRGRVVARFHCPRSVFINTYRPGAFLNTWARLSALTVEELQERQGKHKGLYFLEIEEITEVKKSIPLREFGVSRPPQSWELTALPLPEFWDDPAEAEEARKKLEGAGIEV